ncbi:precorrin-2 C(20)-methyltransferase [Prochlorococcus sp. MIT 1300]|uniref:precorrin-2 C(20)-methyltransferase n=1 Tax=Prochlorococcus sp. MIT 1300 TaxID=3096218 RepID=UPI002A75D866|nr:precorrin-2 C(20)-methyltransferase [Prochlorococcus sp. MIT 1300]
MNHATLAGSNSSPNTLTLVGVGPGEPSLITLAAVQEIKSATVVAYPVAKEGAVGIAATIASQWINENQKRLPLVFPMVCESAPKKKAWRLASDLLVREVENGERVVLLCQGDVSLFATGSYVLLDLKDRHPECMVNVIPGINSISAAAANGLWPLVFQQDQLLILPTPDQLVDLEELLDEAASFRRVLALLKLGDRWEWVRPLLERKGLLDRALFAKNLGLSDQQVVPAANASSGSQPYFSLLLIRQSWPDVMPWN